MRRPCLSRQAPHSRTTPTSLQRAQKLAASRFCCMRWRSCGGKAFALCKSLELSRSAFADAKCAPSRLLLTTCSTQQLQSYTASIRLCQLGIMIA